MPSRTEGELRQSWADTLRMERHRRRWKQQDVADLVGISRRAVGDAEDGRGSLDTFLAIARVLDVDLFAEASS